MYEYNATVVRVVDGDTVILDVDLGFYTYVRMACRLAGINSIELSQPGGSQARTHLAGLLPVGHKVTINSAKPDKYAGRFDGYIFIGAANINQQMIKDGYAAVWNGVGKRPVPAWPLGAKHDRR
jgi:micrococcal nuclease